MISIFRHRKPSRDDEYDALFRSSYPALYRHAYALLSDTDDSRDAVNDVFVKLLQRSDGPPSGGASYLMAMVHNRCLDMLRQRKIEDEARRRLLYESQPTDTDEGSEERLREILRFVETDLTPQTQRILRMCYDEKKTYHQVAEELSISPQAVNKHISQALKKLRERFNPNKEYGKRR